jgi:prepilin-type processing-associated H-X9-DG protein
VQQSVSMQYTLRDLMLVFVLLASALGVFGTWGILVAALLLAIIIVIQCTNKYRWRVLFASPFCMSLIVLTYFHSKPEPINTGYSCSDNIRWMAVGLINYDDVYKKLPLAYLMDTNGNRTRSWRAMIFPIMHFGTEEEFFLRSYDFNEPWDSKKNQMSVCSYVFSIGHYFCPEQSNKRGEKEILEVLAKGSVTTEYLRKISATNYVVVTGTQTLWPENGPGKLIDIPDGAFNTILVMELSKSDIIWTEPRDLTFEQVCNEIDSDPELKMFAAHEIDRGFFSLPDKGANVAFADGSVRCLSTGFLRKYLKAMLTRDGGEKIDFDDLPYPRPNWPRIVALIVLVLSVIALLRRPGKNNPSNTAVVEQSQTIT